MALILSVETSTSVCSAALHDNGTLIADRENHVPQSAASQLAVLVRDVLQESGKQPAALDAIAVSAGPGSYTGLRIGVATAKGMCYALNIPLIAVNALEQMAHAVREKKAPAQAWLCPMLDARRMEVYTMMFDNEMNQVQPVQAKVIDANSFDDTLNKHKLAFFGNGSDKCREVIVDENAVFISGVYPSAAGMGRLAAQRYEQKLFEDTADYEPLYLKDFIVKKPKSQL